MKILRTAIVATLGLSAALALSACHRGKDGGDNGDGHRGRGMDFSDVKFPISKADFITRMNTRMRQRCASRDAQSQQSGRGIDCSTLEAGIAKCTTAAVIPDSIADQDAARDAGRSYFQCVRQQ
ncbi:MAG: hypothetical protein JSR63_10375 [Proteobacteria bacterium]|nr:hypothetical protein [Pseudomonadota bacterium]MBS0218571.1 hypothetical protein [Pseudomonadota bacterium]